MIGRAAVVAIALAIAAGTARADDGDRAFRAAELRAAAGDAGAIDAFEQLGAERPVTRWSDDAWSEAARLAERAGDFARARRDLEQVIAIGSDDQLVRRARGELARLASMTGTAGQWSAVAAEHERLESAVLGGGDPRPALVEFEALVRASPGYPRAVAARLAIAQGWARDGAPERALDWLREAVATARGPEQVTARIALARALIGTGDLAGAGAEIDRLADPIVQGELAAELAVATRRNTLRHVLWGMLAALAIAAAAVLRRDAGSWRGSLRALVCPPLEVWYLAPIAGVLVVVAATGNPLVARAVRAIVLAGAGIAWLSGAMLRTRRRRGPIGARRIIAQAVLAAAAAGAIIYLVIARDQLIDLVAETWRSGPAAR